MFDLISLKQFDSSPLVSQFSIEYRLLKNQKYRSLLIILDREEEVVVLFDNQLPLGVSYEVRSEGIWFDITCEVRNEHWSFSLESFALALDRNEFEEFQKNHEENVRGIRIPFGYELDASSEDGENWILSGDVFIANETISIENVPVELVTK